MVHIQSVFRFQCLFLFLFYFYLSSSFVVFRPLKSRYLSTSNILKGAPNLGVEFTDDDSFSYEFVGEEVEGIPSEAYEQLVPLVENLIAKFSGR